MGKTNKRGRLTSVFIFPGAPRVYRVEFIELILRSVTGGPLAAEDVAIRWCIDRSDQITPLSVLRTSGQ